MGHVIGVLQLIKIVFGDHTIFVIVLINPS